MYEAKILNFFAMYYLTLCDFYVKKLFDINLIV